MFFKLLFKNKYYSYNQIKLFSNKNNSIIKLKKDIKQRLKNKDYLSYKPGEKLTNKKLTALYFDFCRRILFENPHYLPSDVYSHALFRAYGFNKRQFAAGCRMAFDMLGKSLSSARFSAYMKGGVRSCDESDYLQSITTPAGFENIKSIYLSYNANEVFKHLSQTFLGKIFKKTPTFKSTSYNFELSGVQQLSIALLKKYDNVEVSGDTKSSNIDKSNLITLEEDDKTYYFIPVECEDDPPITDDDVLNLRIAIFVGCKITARSEIDLDEQFVRYLPKIYKTFTESAKLRVSFMTSFSEEFDWKIAGIRLGS